jgi:hypothetical protein
MIIHIKTQPEDFRAGLNVIPGSSGGSNAIGKSTFLPILDFVSGGDRTASELTLKPDKTFDFETPVPTTDTPTTTDSYRRASRTGGAGRIKYLKTSDGELPSTTVTKNLIFINGTMGVGKTAVCRELQTKLSYCAFLDGDWCWDSSPFIVLSPVHVDLFEDSIEGTLIVRY